MEITVKIGNWPVPYAILEDLKNEFPGVELAKVEWEWEVPGKILEAEFTLNDEEYDVEYTVTGHRLLMEKPVKMDVVPEAVLTAAKTRFPEAQLEAVEYVAYSNGLVVYEVNFTQNEEGFEVLFSEAGEVMMKGEDL